MKTKLHQRRLEHSLDHARRVFNEAIFAVELVPKGKQTFDQVIERITKDFFQSSQRILFSHLFTEQKPEVFFGIGRDPEELKEDVLRRYLKLFRDYCPTGLGFTPKLSLSKEFKNHGYNCLGKAMAFASFSGQYGMETDLAFSTDHAMCICYDEGTMFLCDPTSGSLWKMNGMVCEHQNYGWYKKVEGDNFRFNYLVVRSVSYGGFYSILKTCEFLKKTPRDHSVTIQNPSYEIELLDIMNPRLPYRELIHSVDWESIIQEFFSGYDDYEKDYRKEWLLEIECVREYRETVSLLSGFDKALFHAIRATHFNGTFGEFHQQTIPILRMASSEVLSFLESGTTFDMILPKKSMIFLKTLREIIVKDERLKEFILKKMRRKLIDNVTES